MRLLGARVTHESSGWLVVADVDGRRKQFGGPHPSRKEADFFAKYMFSGADRWTGAAQRVEPDPMKYPGDGEAGR